MNKKTILIGLGVLAVAGIGYYMWKKKSETKSGACGCSGADGSDEDSSSFVKGDGTDRWENCYLTLRDNDVSKEDATRRCNAATSVRKRGTNYSNAQAGGN